MSAVNAEPRGTVARCPRWSPSTGDASMDPLTPLDTLCRIILRAREYEAQTPTDYDGGEAAENVDDDGEASAVGARRRRSTTASRKNCRRCSSDLGEDQLAEVLAFCWVGQGTYDAADWDEAIEEATAAAARTATGRSTNCSTCRCWPRCSKRGWRRSTSAATGSATSASVRGTDSARAVSHGPPR